jgi:hypothetical protein
MFNSYEMELYSVYVAWKASVFVKIFEFYLVTQSLPFNERYRLQYRIVSSQNSTPPPQKKSEKLCDMTIAGGPGGPGQQTDREHSSRGLEHGP